MDKTKKPATPKTPELDGELMSVRTLAHYLDCGRSTAAAMIAEGVIPSLKIGYLRRVRKADVDDYVSRCTAWEKD